MTRILYLSHCGSSIGGGERQLLYLVTHLDTHRYQPVVVCPDDGAFAAELRDSGISTVILPLPAWRKAKSLLTRRIAAHRLARLAKQEGVALAHTSDSWFNPYLWLMKKQLQLPVVSHVRNVIDARRVRKYRFHRMDRMIAISEQTKAPLVEGGIASEKINVILNCVDLSVFEMGANALNPLRQDYALRRFLVGIVGRIEPFKRQVEFVRIAAKIVQHNKDISFLVIGGVEPHPGHIAYERRLRQLISELCLESHVTLTGHRDDMPAVMKGLDVLVTLSAGSVIGEAMAASKPVIATRIGSAGEMVVDGTTGWLLPEDAIDQVAERILHLSQDRCLCEKMGQAGRTRAEQLLGTEAHAEKVQAIYADLLEQLRQTTQ